MKSMRILRAISQRKIVWALAISVALLIAGVPQAYQAQGVPVTDEREPNNDFTTAQRVRRFPTLIRGTSRAVIPGDVMFGIDLFGLGLLEPLPDFYQVTTRGGAPGDTLVISLNFVSHPVFPSFGGEIKIFDPAPPLGTGFGAGIAPIGGGFNICDLITSFIGFPPCNSDLDLFLFDPTVGFLDVSLNGLPSGEMVTAPIPAGLSNSFLLLGDFGPLSVALNNFFLGTAFEIEGGEQVPYNLKFSVRGLGGGGGGEDISPPTGKVRPVDVAPLVRVDQTLSVSGSELKDVYHLTLDEPESIMLNLTSSAGKAGSIYLFSGSGSELIASSQSVRPAVSQVETLALDAGDYLIGVNKPDASDAIYALTVTRAQDGAIMAAKFEAGLDFFLQRKGLTRADLEEGAERFQEYLSQQ